MVNYNYIDKAKHINNTICLSMIVKNEGHVICDTSSIDNTIEEINKFTNDYNVPGKVFKHKWIDFASNRNLALDISKTKADYSFIFDADDIIHATNNFKLPNTLLSDYYTFKFDKNLTYSRPLLIKYKFI